MKTYKSSGFKAVATHDFILAGENTGVFSVDKDGELISDINLGVKIGDEFEYLFTRNDGFHFVYHVEYDYGTWIHPELLSIENT